MCVSHLGCALVSLVDQYLRHPLDGDGEGYDGVVGGGGGGGPLVPAAPRLVAAPRARRTEHAVTRLTKQQLLNKIFNLETNFFNNNQK